MFTLISSLRSETFHLNYYLKFPDLNSFLWICPRKLWHSFSSDCLIPIQSPKTVFLVILVHVNSGKSSFNHYPFLYGRTIDSFTYTFLNLEFCVCNILLNLLGGQNNQPTEKVKKVRDEYERKLGDMQKEVKKLQTAKKEHAKMLRNQSQYESQIKTLRNEVMDMKKVKVSCCNFFVLQVFFPTFTS